MNISNIWARTSSRKANVMVLELCDLHNLLTVLKWYSNPLHFPGRLVRCGWYFINTSYSIILGLNLFCVLTLSPGVSFTALIVWYVSLVVIRKQFTAVLGVACTIVSTFSLSYSRINLSFQSPSLSLAMEGTGTLESFCDPRLSLRQRRQHWIPDLANRYDIHYNVE